MIDWLSLNLSNKKWQIVTREEIEKIFPHRDEWLIADPDVQFITILEKTNSYILITYQVPKKPWWEKKHFGVFPGNLLGELAAQIFALMVLGFESKDKNPRLKRDNRNYKNRSVVPGDKLFIEAKIIKSRGIIYQGKYNIFAGKMSEENHVMWGELSGFLA